MDKKNIYEIAEQSGVSIATVSRVLNNSEKVSSSTREKVLKVISEQEYFPRKNKDKRLDVLVIINSTDNTKDSYIGYYEGTILNGIVREVQDNDNINFHLLFISHEWSSQRVLKSIKERNTDGIIVLQSNEETNYLKILEDYKVPVVLINNPIQGAFHSIEFENRISTQQAMSHLFEKGHRKIGIFNGHYQFRDMKERVASAVEFLKEVKCYDKSSLILVKEDESKYRYMDNFKRGYEMAKKYHGGLRKLPHTALLFTNSDVCIGAIRYFKDAGIKIPEELSIITFDENASFSYFSPSITTISQPLTTMGRIATKILWDEFSENSTNNRTNITKFIGQLTERESCRNI